MLTFDDLNFNDRYDLVVSLPKTFTKGVEIGVWQGAFTAHMVATTSMHITGIDPWCETSSHADVDYNAEDYNPFAMGNDGYLSQEARYIASITILSKFPPTKWTLLRSYSNRVLPFLSSDVDFVYIDGLHDYESVKQDIHDWFPKLKSGGILSGHDYNDTNPGTVQAVHEFAEESGLEFKITETSPQKGDADAPSWVFIKK